jgi:hypothetical protein
LIYRKDNDLKAAVYLASDEKSTPVFNDFQLLMRETLTAALAFKDYLSGLFR